MKLFYGRNSPYARKVIVCAMLRDIDRQIEKLPVNPHLTPPELAAVNPLSKVPCLVTIDGLALYDSPVIVEFLDTIGEAAPMIPTLAAHRWPVLRQEALGDGIIDAAVVWRREAMREAAPDRHLMDRQTEVILRSLGVLEADVPSRHPDVGMVTIGAALGYIDFRYGELAWRDACPKLAAWWNWFAEEPSMVATRPPGP